MGCLTDIFPFTPSPGGRPEHEGGLCRPGAQVIYKQSGQEAGRDSPAHGPGKLALGSHPLDGPHTEGEQAPYHSILRGENAGSEANRLTGWPQTTKLRYSGSTFFLEQSSEVGMVPQDLGISLPRRLDPPVAEDQERMAHF